MLIIILLIPAAEQSEEQLFDEINKADVICLVYSVEDDDSLEQVRVHWLPLLRHCNVRSVRPVILVGNKADLIEYSTLQTSNPVMEEFPEIEAWLEVGFFVKLLLLLFTNF